MKLVEMHNNEQRDFDNYLRQQLDAAAVDANLGEKYFAGMALPDKPAEAIQEKKNNLIKKGLVLLLILLFPIIGVNYLSYDGTNKASTKNNSPKQKAIATDNIKSETNNDEHKNNPVNKNTYGSLPEKKADHLVQTIKKDEIKTNNTNLSAKNKTKHDAVLSFKNIIITPRSTFHIDSLALISKREIPPAVKQPPGPVKEKKTADSVYIIW
jgi:hypothetical protein